MPKSKTQRKSKSGQSRKTNRLKNGNSRYRPGMGLIPGRPKDLMDLPEATDALSILQRPDEHNQESAHNPEPNSLPPVVIPFRNVPPPTSNPPQRTQK